MQNLKSVETSFWCFISRGRNFVLDDTSMEKLFVEDKVAMRIFVLKRLHCLCGSFNGAVSRCG
jgi:hypothetical protein